MIIWGSRTARNAKGFVVRGCACGGERVHLVVEVKTKFTLYFVPTFTTSRKAVVICTDCERVTELVGEDASATLEATVSREAMISRLEAQAHAGAVDAEPAAGPTDPARELAVAFLIMMTTVALVDRRVEEREMVAGVRGLSTIAAASGAAIVRDAAALARDGYDELMTWIQAPSTGPLADMLARAGRRVRELAETDRMRYVGQLAWLGQEVAAEAPGSDDGPSAAAMDRIDEAFARMGVSPREAAAALAYCVRQGG